MSARPEARRSCRRRRWLAFALTTLLLPIGAATAPAAEIRVEVELEPSSVAEHEPVQLTVEVQGGGFRAFQMRPTFALENLEVAGGPHRRESFQFRSGETLRSERLAWLLRPLGPGAAAVRDLRVRIRGRLVDLPDQEIEVVAGGRPPAPAPDADPFRELLTPFLREPPEAFLRAEVSGTRPFVGERVLYTLFLYSQGEIGAVEPESLPGFAGFWVEEIAPSENLRVEMVDLGGERYGRVPLLKRALYPLRPGRLAVEPARAHLVVRAADAGLFAPFLGRGRELSRESNPLVLEARQLPPAPPGFAGAVGDLDLTADLEPRRVEVGEAAVLTLRLAGTGNLQGLLPPEVDWPVDLEALPPTRDGEGAAPGGWPAGRRWTYVLVPGREGRWELPRVEVPYFDPATGRFEVATSALPVLTAVAPATAAAGSPPPHNIRSAVLPGAAGGGPAPEALWWGLFLFPGAAVAIAGLVRRRRPGRGLPADPVSQALLEAAQSDRPRRAAVALEAGWRAFLEDRRGIPSSLPSSRWAAELASRGAPRSAVTEIARLVEELRYLRQAPELSATESLRTEVMRRARRLQRTLM